MRWYHYLFFSLIIIMFAGPISVVMTGQIDLHRDWRNADRSSMHIAPNPQTTKEAVVQVYGARTFDWRGMFAIHTWIAVKPEGAKKYIIYQSLGWNYYYKKPYIEANVGVPDASWFGQRPKVMLDLRGEKASEAIKQIKHAVEKYPFKNKYTFWPGPNSNTFIAYLVRNVPSLHMVLPVTMIGKDCLANSHFFTKAASGTGYQFSFYGIFGITLAFKEGLEFNIFGVSFGVSLFPPLLNLPGYGIIQ